MQVKRRIRSILSYGVNMYVVTRFSKCFQPPYAFSTVCLHVRSYYLDVKDGEAPPRPLLFKIAQSVSTTHQNSSSGLLIADHWFSPERVTRAQERWCMDTRCLSIIEVADWRGEPPVSQTSCYSRWVRAPGLPLSCTERDGSEVVGLWGQVPGSFSPCVLELSLCGEHDQTRVSRLWGSAASHSHMRREGEVSDQAPTFQPSQPKCQEQAWRSPQEIQHLPPSQQPHERQWATTAQLSQEPWKMIVNCCLKSLSLGWADRQQQMTGNMMYKTFPTFLSKCLYIYSLYIYSLYILKQTNLWSLS